MRPRLPFVPALRWPLAIGLAAVTALTIAGALHRADATRRAWGETRPVIVASRDLAPGAVVTAGDVERLDWPVAVVPAGALRDPPIGQVVRAGVVRGEAVVATRLAPRGLTGAAALVPDGWRAIAVATGPATLAVAPGDTVDVYATVDPTAGAGGPPTVAVATNARVVAVGDRSVTVAVPETAVARVAFAATIGSVTLVLAPGPSAAGR